MKIAYLALPVFALAACGPSGDSAGFTKNSCSAVQSVLAEGAKDEPYAALRGAPVMLGDRPLKDQWTAKKIAFGETCQTSVIRDMFGVDMYIYSCDLYASPGSFEKDAKEIEARQAITSVRETIESCLGEDWLVEEDTKNSDYQIYQKYLFEPKSGRPGADKYDFTADPIYIEMSYTPFMRGRGGPTGWLAKVQFQEQREAAKKD